MIEQTSAAEIGIHGYAHWSGKRTTPGSHTILYVPQTIADGWEAYCSCGQWRAFVSMYDEPTREGTLAALDARFKLHCEAAAEADKAKPVLARKKKRKRISQRRRASTRPKA